MPCDVAALCVDALDPERLARFWSVVLGGAVVPDPEGGSFLDPADDPGFRLRFVPTTVPGSGRNRIHLDLTSTSQEDQDAIVARALAAGGRPFDVGQLPEERHMVLADPEGNEFCVIEPENRFLAGCGPIGALSGDGSQAAGYFWRDALGWPLVWGEGTETAVQSPAGGPKFTWGGDPVEPKRGRNRWRLDLRARGDRRAELDRLLALGARADGSDLLDPSGNEFRLL
ncbi:VOC family protein [Kineococcus rhizosphaerae]|uniref:VOC domain-containing protein n=1 Tax=Kineococcus rhizosphaerae TaxID=559628 RepID=A0A2T0R702_9ACTN|nr:VOC family protein [Kineococcus rhizosphaerae]PRY16891.1 hypothetical protein CLV37_103323 [Kineococcus rhizosphaerae]